MSNIQTESDLIRHSNGDVSTKGYVKDEHGQLHESWMRWKKQHVEAEKRAVKMDRKWFRKHPDARERVRPTIPGEFWDMPDFKGMTRVMQLAPGARTRTAIQPTKQDLEESERLSRWMSLMHHAEDGLQ